MRPPIVIALALALGMAPLAAETADAPRATAADPWAGCCGLPLWAHPGELPVNPGRRSGFMGGYSSLVAGSNVRHHIARTEGAPSPYASLRNPLPPTPENARHGAAIYEAQCASCHGVTGLGDGPAASELNPPPAHLGWLTLVPARHRDGFMYWAIAEGGKKPFGTGMPSYKGKLSDEEIWAVIGYIQARLPKSRTAAR